MKKIFFVFLLLSIISVALFSEETNIQKEWIRAPYIGVFTRTEFANYHEADGVFDEKEQWIQTLVLDLMLGKRGYFYGQLAFSYPLTAVTDKSVEGFNLYAGIGAGMYILDKRVDGLGHSWNANLSFLFSTLPYTMIGYEFSTFYNYNFYKRLALRIGLSVSMRETGSIFDALKTGSPNYKNGMYYGLSIGLAF